MHICKSSLNLEWYILCRTIFTLYLTKLLPLLLWQYNKYTNLSKKHYHSDILNPPVSSFQPHPDPSQFRKYLPIISDFKSDVSNDCMQQWYYPYPNFWQSLLTKYIYIAIWSLDWLQSTTHRTQSPTRLRTDFQKICVVKQTALYANKCKVCGELQPT